MPALASAFAFAIILCAVAVIGALALGIDPSTLAIGLFALCGAAEIVMKG